MENTGIFMDIPSGHQTWLEKMDHLSMIFRIKPPFIGDLPLPYLITGGYKIVPGDYEVSQNLGHLTSTCHFQSSSWKMTIKVYDGIWLCRKMSCTHLSWWIHWVSPSKIFQKSSTSRFGAPSPASRGLGTSRVEIHSLHTTNRKTEEMLR